MTTNGDFNSSYQEMLTNINKYSEKKFDEDQPELSRLGDEFQGEYDRCFWTVKKYVGNSQFSTKEQFIALILEWLYSEDNAEGFGMFEGYDTSQEPFLTPVQLESKVNNRKSVYGYNSKSFSDIFANIQLNPDSELEAYLKTPEVTKHLCSISKKINAYYKAYLDEMKAVYQLEKSHNQRINQKLNSERITYML